MSIRYPQEILEQQIKARKELEKLARMRTDYLKSTGQMPPSASKTTPSSSDTTRVTTSPTAGHPEEVTAF